ncbi:hypothetical protein THIOSC15_2520025 [uncultured Thiomicrorhabdus sp.]
MIVKFLSDNRIKYEFSTDPKANGTYFASINSLDLVFPIL